MKKIQPENQALRELRNDTTLVIKGADKGSGIASSEKVPFSVFGQSLGRCPWENDFSLGLGVGCDSKGQTTDTVNSTLESLDIVCVPVRLISFNPQT